MATAGIPNIGDTAAGRWGDASVIGRVVSKNGGTQLALFSDKPGPAQVVTVFDAQLVAEAEPQWSKDLCRAAQIDAAQFEQWRSGIEARRVDTLRQAELATARHAELKRATTIAADRADCARGVEMER